MKGSIAQRHNNPGNLIFANQKGAVKGEQREDGTYWAMFPTPQAGYNAVKNQVKIDSSRGLTVSQFVQKYAPASDNNNTNDYINFLLKGISTKVSNVTGNTKLSDIISQTGVEPLAELIVKREDSNFAATLFNPTPKTGNTPINTKSVQSPLVLKQPPTPTSVHSSTGNNNQSVVDNIFTQLKDPNNPNRSELLKRYQEEINKNKNNPKPKPISQAQESSILDDMTNTISTGFNEAIRNIESIPEMLSRAWVKYGFGDAANDRTQTVPTTTLKLTPSKTSIIKPKIKEESKIQKLPITPIYKEFGTTKEGYFSYVNVFDNTKGFNYVPTTRIEKDSVYSNVQGMAHFLFDYDMTSDKPANNSNTASLHKSIKYKEDGSIDITSLKNHRTNQPGSSVKDRYYTVYKKNEDGTVNIKYKKANEIVKGDKIGDDLRQYRFTDINWNSGVQAPNFNKTIQTLSTKDNQPTYFIFAKGLGKNAYGKYGGGSVVFLIEGTNVAIDFAGSINQIKTQGLSLIDYFKIKPEQLIVAYHDVGSYSAKPDDRGGKIASNRYYGFNTNKQTGAGIAIPQTIKP